MNREIGLRIKELRDNFKLTQSEFSAQIGIKQANLSHIENYGKKISIEVINGIISNFNISSEWLLTGTGSMLKGEEKHAAIEADESDVKAVYLYNVSASAGYGNFDELIRKENIISKYVIPDFKDIDFMINVTGSSMYPKYSSGDIIACRELKESRFIQWGKVYVIATREQGILVKRLEEEDNESILVRSDNQQYKPFKVPKEEIMGIALVVGVIRLE